MEDDIYGESPDTADNPSMNEDDYNEEVWDQVIQLGTEAELYRY